MEVHWPPAVRLLLGVDSLALSTGAEHATRRQAVLQAFTPAALRQYVPGMQVLTDGSRGGTHA